MNGSTSAPPPVVAWVTDLMDRSRFGGLDVTFVRDRDALLAAITPDATAVVDLGRPGALDALAQIVAAAATVVAFAPHVDDDVMATARSVGVEVLPRSRFFREVPAALA